MLGELSELQRRNNPNTSSSPVDLLRRKYLRKLSEHTERATIVYATAWLEDLDLPGSALSVTLGDVQGFMEACSNIQERNLDLILSSPGGSADAAESIMSYLRSRFDHIRVIVPVAAMSAATMMALAADEIVMGSHSQLGPIDPQFTISTPEGPRTAPGQAIIDQFEQAKLECRDPANIGAWLPILRSLLPGLLAQCAAARERAEEFAKQNLETYMFAGQEDATAKSESAAAWFSDFTAFKSHGRRVGRAEARSQGLTVTDLEADPVLQDLALSVYHATRLTFTTTGTVKLIENQHGRAFLYQVAQVQVPFPVPQPIPQPAPQP